MLRSLRVSNFTVFPEVRLDFARGLNVIVGENGTGKTHLLKLPYAVAAVSSEEGRRRDSRVPTKAFLQARIAEKLVDVFRPEDARLGRLTRRQQGRNRCEVSIHFMQRRTSIAFNFASQNKSEVVVDRTPRKWVDEKPVYLPPRELLTIYPGFVSLYETHDVEFEETLRDTCLLLGAPTVRGPRRIRVANLLEPLEDQIGRVVLESNGRFYLRQPGKATMEMPLVAEGWRKLAMLSRLIATGSILEKGVLFWDEPEANLNPKLIREVARAILRICESGVQVIVATHSLFLLREFELLLKREFSEVDQRYFALRHDENGVQISQSGEVGEVDPLVLLDEELKQSDRYLERLMP
ncbi:MAG: AAA family ATPase [Rhodospirillaceae bacterium]|nr:AAA family ATPase [Rhodospirillaceae bacterium]